MFKTWARTAPKRRSYVRRGVKNIVRRRGGLSLLQISSRTRMDPPWKKRRYNAISVENDADSSVSQNGVQTSHGRTAPLSVSRFSHPSATVFDYHHYVRRFQTDPITVYNGIAGSLSNVASYTSLNAVSDAADLIKIYDRYRVVRVVVEFMPVYGAGNTNALPAEQVYYRLWRGDDQITTVQGMLNDADTEITMSNKPFTITFTPNTIFNETDEKISGASAGKEITLAPWLTTANNDVKQYGWQVMMVNRQAYDAAYLRYSVFVTMYFDMDHCQ